MRISAGRLKGRKTASRRVLSRERSDAGLRPTSSKVREALFDILRNELQGARFLDLYAGTGTVGLEALSRGADEAFFVERDRILAGTISECISRMNLGGTAHLHLNEAGDFLKKAASGGMDFDIIFADPPYASDELSKILPEIDSGSILKAGGCLVVEHPSRITLPDNFLSIRLIKKYRYGDTMLTLYRRET